MGDEAIYISPRHLAGCPAALTPLIEMENYQKFIDSLIATVTSYLTWVALFPQDTESSCSPLRDVMWQFVLNLAKERGLIRSRGYSDLADILERADRLIERHGPKNEHHHYNGLTVEARGTLAALDILDLPASFTPAQGSFTPAQSVLVSGITNFRATYGDPEDVLILPEADCGTSAVATPPAIESSFPQPQIVHIPPSASLSQPVPPAPDHPCIFSYSDPTPSPTLIDVTQFPSSPKCPAGIVYPSTSPDVTEPKDLTSRFFLRAIAAHRLHASTSIRLNEGPCLPNNISTPSSDNSTLPSAPAPGSDSCCDSSEKQNASKPAPTNAGSSSNTTTTTPPPSAHPSPATKRNRHSSEADNKSNCVPSTSSHSSGPVASSSPSSSASATKRRRRPCEGEDTTLTASLTHIPRSSDTDTASSYSSPTIKNSRDASEEDTTHPVPSSSAISCASDTATSPPLPPISPTKRRRDSSEEDDIRPTKRVIHDRSPPVPDARILIRSRVSPPNRIPRRTSEDQDSNPSTSSVNLQSRSRAKAVKERCSMSVSDRDFDQGTYPTASPDSGYGTSPPPSPRREIVALPSAIIVESENVGAKVREVARRLLRASTSKMVDHIRRNSNAPISGMLHVEGKKRTRDLLEGESEAYSGTFGRLSKKPRK